MVLTWIHDCPGPHFLYTEPGHLSSLVIVDVTGTVVVGVVLWLDVAIVDTMRHLKVLQMVLHILL